jgi:hypothetical protein
LKATLRGALRELRSVRRPRSQPTGQ